jgi:acetyl esterase/lipase
MTWRPKRRRAIRLVFLAILLPLSLQGVAQAWKNLDPRKPWPTQSNVRYGPFSRNVFDIWQASETSEHPGPRSVVIFFHGGGFIGGDKRSVPAWLVDRCLAEGITVVSANYRLSRQSPYPSPMLDGARVIQFLRSQASELKIDPDRIAGCGNSAGGGISLWAAFHTDLADPGSADPVLRESSRLTCVGVVGAQTSYDPRFIQKLIGGRAHEHVAIKPLFGMTDATDPDDPKLLRAFEDASPLNHVTSSAPPVLLFFSEPKGPLPENPRQGLGIHHPRFGDALKAKLDPLGVECILRHGDDYRDRERPEEAMYRDLVSFFATHLR